MSDSRAMPAAAGNCRSALQGMLLLLAQMLLLAGLVYGLATQVVAVRPPPQPLVAAVKVAAAPLPPPPLAPPPVTAETLTPRMRAALVYAARHYRVSAEALAPIFAATQRTAHELRLDPLLIIAVIGIESGFNPFSESTMGAQGLMQVIPRYHRDKLPEDASRLHLFDPVANIRVGARALYEYIRSNGDVADGLQQFAGDPDDPEQAYADKVLAEKERLESAAQHRRGLLASGAEPTAPAPIHAAVTSVESGVQ